MEGGKVEMGGENDGICRGGREMINLDVRCLKWNGMECEHIVLLSVKLNIASVAVY